VLIALAAIIVAGQSLNRSNDAQEAVALSSGVQVGLTEFALTPSDVEVEADGSISVTNDGSVEHNLAVKDTGLRTDNLSPGGRARLDLSSLDTGMYTIFCELPGHEAAGMSGMLMLGTTHGAAAGAADGASSAGINTKLNDEIDERMAGPTKAFPAATEGVGAQDMAPTVLADGTKQFDLTAEIVDWEVEPGRTVEAWSYNGTVPAPTLRVEVGDKVRMVLRNNLPESTVLHLHGLPNLPNAMDGVPDITQPPIKPGESFTYEFVADGPAIGMYHSHHHAAHQVPNGLFGAIYVGQLPIPAGITVSQKIPMIVNDAGTIGLTLNGKSFPATAPITAKLGDWVQIDYFNEGLQVHPMHLHGVEQLVFAKDGMTVPAPYRADTVLVAPGERYSVLVNATNPGVWAFHCHILTHAESDAGMFGMVTAFIIE
jgi:FtsP/CotA-like multicopper oxidase with cupredoxin domain